MSIYQLMVSFRNFLNSSWPSVMETMEEHDWDDSPYFLDQWIQANWELLVEKHILEPKQLLVPYGYNSSPGCRYSHKEDKSTHRVVCKKKGDADFGYIFLCFESKMKGAYSISPPFDYASIKNIKEGTILDVDFKALEFAIEPIV